MAKIGRPGAAKGKKGAVKGTGGHGRQALEGRGPTPKAEDRPYHKAYKAKKAAAAGVKPKAETRSSRKGEFVAGRSGMGARAISGEVLSGRNSVVEALKAKIPATALFIAQRIEMDDRVKESIAIANGRGIPLSEVTRAEIDRMTGGDSVHQGIALQVPPYNYKHPMELLDRALSTGHLPLLVALDGVTDPRNLGAIIRSIAAFGGHASNLNQTIKEYKARGVFVIGLDGDGDVMLPEFTLADKPLLVVVGSEGKGLSRLVQENCDQVVSIPITAATESLNAGIAASVALYQISSMRS
ncbi:MAG: rRNA ((2251)-2-O)-methyltransferase RlmB [Actinomycetota bacterium]